MCSYFKNCPHITHLGGCYSPRPSASVDNTLLDLPNSSYPTRPHSIIANYFSAGRFCFAVIWFCSPVGWFFFVVNWYCFSAGWLCFALSWFCFAVGWFWVVLPWVDFIYFAELCWFCFAMSWFCFTCADFPWVDFVLQWGFCFCFWSISITAKILKRNKPKDCFTFIIQRTLIKTIREDDWRGFKRCEKIF